MPNSKTFLIKPIGELIYKYAYGKIIDPCANNSKIATINNDLDIQYNTDYHMDVELCSGIGAHIKGNKEYKFVRC